MFGTLSKEFILDAVSEVTIEVNPGTIRPEQLELFKRVGINRLSIGVQGLKDQVLKKLNRHQSAADVYYVLEHAQGIFDNVSVDIILGLPGVSADEWKDLVAKVVTWPIKHVSLYFLTVHESTPLYFGIKAKKITLPCDEEMVDLYYWSIKTLEKHGFEHYEISSFAKSGYRAQHNTVYWDRKPYKGVGLGACSFDGTVRLQNEKNLMRYMAGVQQGNDVTIFSETLNNQQMYLEKIMLGLRRSEGVALHDLFETVSDDKRDTIKKQMEILKERGLVNENQGRLVLTPAGVAVENEIVVSLS